MSYRPPSDEKLRLSSISFEGWAWICFSLTLGAVAFFAVFHLLAWAAGWPGPFLWFGTESRLQDIFWAIFGIGFATFFANLFGVLGVLSALAIRKLLTRRDA